MAANATVVIVFFMRMNLPFVSLLALYQFCKKYATLSICNFTPSDLPLEFPAWSASQRRLRLIAPLTVHDLILVLIQIQRDIEFIQPR